MGEVLDVEVNARDTDTDLGPPMLCSSKAAFMNDRDTVTEQSGNGNGAQQPSLRGTQRTYYSPVFTTRCHQRQSPSLFTGLN